MHHMAVDTSWNFKYKNWYNTSHGVFTIWACSNAPVYEEN